MSDDDKDKPTNVISLVEGKEELEDEPEYLAIIKHGKGDVEEVIFNYHHMSEHFPDCMEFYAIDGVDADKMYLVYRQNLKHYISMTITELV